MEGDERCLEAPLIDCGPSGRLAASPRAVIWRRPTEARSGRGLAPWESWSAAPARTSGTSSPSRCTSGSSAMSCQVRQAPLAALRARRACCGRIPRLEPAQPGTGARHWWQRMGGHAILRSGQLVAKRAHGARDVAPAAGAAPLPPRTSRVPAQPVRTPAYAARGRAPPVDTVLVFTEKEVHVLTSQKKGARLPCGERGRRAGRAAAVAMEGRGRILSRGPLLRGGVRSCGLEIQHFAHCGSGGRVSCGRKQAGAARGAPPAPRPFSTLLSHPPPLDSSPQPTCFSR